MGKMKKFETRPTATLTKAQREYILKRDEHKCVMCGMGEREGYAVVVADVGLGLAGSTLKGPMAVCERHVGKTVGDMFADLASRASAVGDTQLATFANAISKKGKQHE